MKFLHPPLKRLLFSVQMQSNAGITCSTGMENSPLLLIVNPAAGKEEPILELAEKVFHNSGIMMDVHVLTKGEDPGEVARLAAQTYQMIAVYGGDGSITEAAAGLIGQQVPLAIIPGGTANVLSKELHIPQDTETALRLIADGNYTLKQIDTGLVNGKPFLLRVNLGLMADMITEADPDLKDKVGQLAYGVSAFKSWQDAEIVEYQLIVDGEALTLPGVSLTVTNSGNMGIGELQIAQGIRVDDGLLDIVVLKEAGLLAVAGAAGSSLLGKESDAVNHRTCRVVEIKLNTEQTYICDDCDAKATSLSISVVPSSLTVVVPQKN
jgi:diacylglycerol kinase (ATP)